MVGSHYPNGFSGGVSVRGMPILNVYGGNVFWVDSVSGSNSYDGTEKRPFADLDYTVGKCTANNGDIIYVAPGHAETVIAAAGLDFDVAGIEVIGFGVGTTRPTITISMLVPSKQMTLPATNSTPPSSMIGRRPNRSASGP